MNDLLLNTAVILRDKYLCSVTLKIYLQINVVNIIIFLCSSCLHTSDMSIVGHINTCNVVLCY